LLPALGLTLILLEIALIGLGMFYPRVDGYYADYYINRYRTCWLTPAIAQGAESALRATPLTISALAPASACLLLKRGWSDPEPWGVWSDGKIAQLEVPARPREKLLVLTITAFSPRNRQVVTVHVNDTYAGKFFVPSARVTKLSIAVPPDAKGDMIISFRIKHPSRPADFGGGIDQREIGLGLIGIAWGS